MSKSTKNINIEVSLECWKTLKKISIDKETSLQHVVSEMLEKIINKKVKQEVIEEN